MPCGVYENGGRCAETSPYDEDVPDACELYADDFINQDWSFRPMGNRRNGMKRIKFKAKAMENGEHRDEKPSRSLREA